MAQTPSRWRTVMTPRLVLHATSVVALTALFFYLFSLSGPDDGANIGAATAPQNTRAGRDRLR